MTNNLKYIFTTVNEWLRFLEAKHTALIALNGAAVIGLTQALKDIGNPSIKMLIPYVLIPGLLIGALISLFSMTKLAAKLGKFAKSDRLSNPNVLYFGYISALKLIDYKAELLAKGFTSNPVTIKQDLLINQIYINSTIAFGKQRLFHWAMFITFGTYGSSFLIFWITRWFCV